MIKKYNEFILNEEINLKSTLKMLLITGMLTVSYMSNLLANYDNKYLLQTYKEVLKETGEKEDQKIINLFQPLDTNLIPVIIFAVDTTEHPDVYYYKQNPEDDSYSDDLSNNWIVQINGFVDDNNFYDGNKKILDKKYKIINYSIKTKELNVSVDLSEIINNYLYDNFKTKANDNTKLYEIGLNDDNVFQIIVYVEGKLGIRVNDNEMINILLNKNLTLKELIDFIKKYIKP